VFVQAVSGPQRDGGDADPLHGAPPGDGRLAVTLTVGAHELSNRIIGL
jgi:hypothetical protein